MLEIFRKELFLQCQQWCLPFEMKRNIVNGRILKEISGQKLIYVYGLVQFDKVKAQTNST